VPEKEVLIRIHKRRLHSAAALKTAISQQDSSNTFSTNLSLAKGFIENIDDTLKTLQGFRAYFVGRVGEWRHAYRGESRSLEKSLVSESDFLIGPPPQQCSSSEDDEAARSTEGKALVCLPLRLSSNFVFCRWFGRGPWRNSDLKQPFALHHPNQGGPEQIWSRAGSKEGLAGDLDRGLEFINTRRFGIFTLEKKFELIFEF
jgi:hypothetical protein